MAIVREVSVRVGFFRFFQSFQLVLQIKLVEYDIFMFNNFTSEKEYQACNVVVQACQGRGALLLGDFNSATDQQIIKQNSIKTIITAAQGMKHLQIPHTVTHIVYPLQDSKSENIKVYFDQCFTTIERKLRDGAVLVHCAAGVSRSATLVIAYLMKKHRIGFKQAITQVKSRRAGVCPNLGFEMQLKKYETEILPIEPKEQRREMRRTDNKPTDIKRLSFDQKKVVHLDSRKKIQVKKAITRHTGYSKPRERQKLKPCADLIQGSLFVSGKAAKRPLSQIQNILGKQKKQKLDSLMGTWGPLMHKYKQFQL